MSHDFSLIFLFSSDCAWFDDTLQDVVLKRFCTEREVESKESEQESTVGLCI